MIFHPPEKGFRFWSSHMRPISEPQGEVTGTHVFGSHVVLESYVRGRAGPSPSGALSEVDRGGFPERYLYLLIWVSKYRYMNLLKPLLQ